MSCAKFLANAWLRLSELIYHRVWKFYDGKNFEKWAPCPSFPPQSIVIGFVFITTVQRMVRANNGVHYGLKVVFVCLHITLSPYHTCLKALKYQTLACYILLNVCLWFSQFSQLTFMQYIDGLVQDCSNSIAYALVLLQSCTKPSIWGCVFSAYQCSFDVWENIWILLYLILSYLTIINSEIWIIHPHVCQLRTESSLQAIMAVTAFPTPLK